MPYPHAKERKRKQLLREEEEGRTMCTYEVVGEWGRCCREAESNQYQHHTIEEYSLAQLAKRKEQE